MPPIGLSIPHFPISIRQLLLWVQHDACIRRTFAVSFLPLTESIFPSLGQLPLEVFQGFGVGLLHGLAIAGWSTSVKQVSHQPI
jgi:hypothetical protein